MGKISWKGVILGGLLAGVVLNVFDWAVYGMWLKNDFAAAMQALGKGAMPDSLIGWFVFLDFVYGIALLWVYAAIRPRFGAGVKTAVIAGFVVWLFIAFLHGLGEAPMGLLPQRLYVLPTIIALFQIPIATAVGAYLYKEA
jgi:hypothetical protein